MNRLLSATVKPIGTPHLGSLSADQIWAMWGVLAFVITVRFGLAAQIRQDGPTRIPRFRSCSR